MNVTSATILICTYNRARHLRETLAALVAMNPVANCEVEIIVVDNNSTDNTAAVVQEAARDASVRVVYASEKQQGKSFALNRGLETARGDIVALTDDDVLPAVDWLQRIVENFRARQVTFVFGKVLPRWGATPPPELLSKRAQDVWGPLAIVDYGDEATDYVAESTGQRLPVGANLAFARSALVTIGGWRTDLGKVDNSLISGEDHEIFMRLRRFALYSGYYDPEVSVRHYVPPSRLTRRYFREWFYWHGKTQALMLDDLYQNLDMSTVPRIAGVPRFLYRQGLQQLRKWLGTVGRRDALGELIEEVRTLQFAGLYLSLWTRYIQSARVWTRSARSELRHSDLER